MKNILSVIAVTIFFFVLMNPLRASESFNDDIIPIIIESVLAGGSAIQAPQSSTITIVARNSRNSNPRGYVEYLPPNYVNRDDWPVVVYFHGIGSPTGSGSLDDLAILTSVEIGAYLNSEDRDFIVLIPQDHNGFWGNRAYPFVEWALSEYQQKDNRDSWHAIYMSGAGGGFNRYCEDNPASLAIIASHTPASSLTTNGDTASYQNCADSGASFWFHHEENDNVVGSGQTQNYYRGILDEVGAQNLDKYRYTLYDGVGHNADDFAFRGTGINTSQVTGDITTMPFRMQWYNWLNGSWWDWLLLQER